MTWVTGLHHITGAATDGQKDHDFYTKVLGLRRVKKTINHETADQWHLFYGDHDGNAGTIMTNFFFEDTPLPPWKRGRGTISDVAFSVPRGSLDFWEERLKADGLPTERRGERFGEAVLGYQDPSGIPSELIEHDDERNPPALGDLDDTNKVRGFHSSTLISRLPELSLGFFTQLLQGKVVGEENGRTRIAFADDGATGFIDLLDGADLPWGHWGLGGIHHVALTVESKEQMEMLWRVLSGAGLILTDLRDRQWFHSMYMTEPGGINVEFSNLDPGWTVDEPLEELGSTLSLPKQWADQREEIVAKLPELRFD
ncbi:MAG: VOC family protein [Acidobacteriota bacterium]